MFASQAASSPRPTRRHFANRSPLPRPFPPNQCHPERSEGSAFLLLLATRHLPLTTVSLTPFPATLADDLQLAENTATLSPLPATLTSRVKLNPFVCHSCKKHPGWGAAIAVLPVTSHKSPVTSSALFLPPAANHKSQVAKSFTIRTSAKRARNSRRIRTSKTQDLKSFRMNTYRKTGEGAPYPSSVRYSPLTTHYSLPLP